MPVADAKGLMNADAVQTSRDKLYTGLEQHCFQMHPDEKTRFAKILLRLPSLRSISLKCPETIFFSQLERTPPVSFEEYVTRVLQENQSACQMFSPLSDEFLM